MEESKHLIVIIDDDPQINTLVSLMMNKIHAETLSFSTGAAALEWLAKGEPVSVILLDLMMPGMDGFEVLRRMRATPSLDNTPILLFSAAIDNNRVRYALDMGADGYVTKSYMDKSLITRVETMIKAGRQNQQVEDQTATEAGSTIIHHGGVHRDDQPFKQYSLNSTAPGDTVPQNQPAEGQAPTEPASTPVSQVMHHSGVHRDSQPFKQHSPNSTTQGEAVPRSGERVTQNVDQP